MFNFERDHLTIVIQHLTEDKTSNTSSDELRLLRKITQFKKSVLEEFLDGATAVDLLEIPDTAVFLVCAERKKSCTFF